MNMIIIELHIPKLNDWNIAECQVSKKLWCSVLVLFFDFFLTVMDLENDQKTFKKTPPPPPLLFGKKFGISHHFPSI